MENNDTQTPVTSVAPKSLDEVEHNAQPTGVSDKPADAASPQAREEAANHEDPGVTKEELAQAKDSAEKSESRDAISAEAKAAGSSATAATQSYVPPVKRFSAVNINKKFLQKNQSSTAGGGGTSSGSSSSKQAGVIARPAPQSAHSHSRLVTAKLTATPISSSAGQGWSRPNSVTPPAPSPANAAGPTKGPTPTIAPVGGHGPPHIAPGGKIIQPQVLKQKVDGPGRPAWRSVQPGAINSGIPAQNEFPTAAEAAQSRLLKLADMKAAADVSDAQKQALSETADAFRGVHLDPNAHHWDEMEEEDNDDFLGDVIEFGDGRQYTIQVTDGTKIDPKALEDGSGNLGPEGPVSKAERFADDFDRSWPKSRQEQGAHPFYDGHGAHKDESTHHGRASHSETSSNLSGHSPVSVRDGSQSRVLFNERLNRMEPISGSRPESGSHLPAHGASIHRDVPDAPGRFHNNRIERDAPPHSAFTNTRKLHEPSWNMPYGLEQHAREIREIQSESPTSIFHGEHHDRKGRSEWASSVTHSGPPPNGWPFGSREPSASRSTVNGAPSVASSDDQGSRHAPSIRDQQRAHFPPSGHPREMDRQLPPHLMHSRSAFPHEGSSAEGDTYKAGHHVPSDALSESTPAKDHDQPQPQPARITQVQSDTVVSKAASSIPPDDVEALRKAFLADSAERAKKRRQQEEEERLKAQERARKKAAELEARIAAAKTAETTKDAPEPTKKSAVDFASTASAAEVDKGKPTETEVLSIIEEAVGSVAPSEITPKDKAGEPRGKEAVVPRPSFAKALSHGDSVHPPPAPEAQEPAQSRRPPSTAVSDRADSWRAKPKPPMLPVQNSKNDISHESAMAVLPSVRAFELQADESMEVIDFSDMGRLVGERTSQEHGVVDSTSLKPARAVASDFFMGSVAEKTEQESWRRASAVPHRSYSAAAENGLTHASYQEPSATLPEAKAVPHVNEDQVHLKVPLSPTNGFSPQLVPNHSGHPPTSLGVPKFLRSPTASYREAPLSALDDTMSRIKGALDVMHSVAEHGSKGDAKDVGSSPNLQSTAPVSGPSKPNKWLPPALRPPGTELNQRRTETFEFTRPEPPRSPAPPDSSYAIRLPNVSRRVEPLTRKQMNHQKHFGPVRWEILSFDPPVEGMTKKSLLVNDVLFRKPQGPYKSRKYRVLLPKSNSTPRPPSGNGSHRVVSDTNPAESTPKDMTIGAFGRSSELGSWRSTSVSARAEGVGSSGKHVAPMLDVTSRSPPPELISAKKTECPPAMSGAASKPKPSQKPLDGTDVAFYRDVRRHTDSNTAPTVTFTVGSELEGQTDMSPSRKTPALSAEATKPSQGDISELTAPEVRAVSLTYPAPSAQSASPSDVELPSSSPAMTTQPLSQTGVDGRTFEQQSDPFLQRQPVTPPPQSTPSTWGKSPARAPDPEHLKAVWSQASNNESIPTVNSLKSIADDLTAVPFTLQEVKSEGGTPPPPPPGPVAPPTRMSASEVTRAFQTVPSGPSNGMPSTALRGSQMPSNLGSPIGSQRPLKPPAIGLPPPPSMNPNAPRPPYMTYPTSMNNHSPSPPTLVYSHVMPNGMPGSPSASPYGQPVWMPLVQQGPQMLRAQPSSPYSPSLMPYPMPGAQNGMFPPSNSMSNPQGSPASYPSAPPPSQMMVSPVLSHASPVPPHMMYPGSPMLVHVPPPGGTPQPRAYPPGVVGMGRGSMPVQNPMDPRSHPPPGPPAAPASRFPVHNPGYTPVPQSFVRPW